MGMYQVDILPQRSYLHTQARGTIGGTVAPLRNRKNVVENFLKSWHPAKWKNYRLKMQ